MALGLTLGIMLAVSGGNTTHVDQSSLGLGHPVRERLGVSLGDLACQNLALTNPVTIVPRRERRGRVRRHPPPRSGRPPPAPTPPACQGNGGQGNQRSWQPDWRQFLGRGGQDNQQDGGIPRPDR